MIIAISSVLSFLCLIFSAMTFFGNFTVGLVSLVLAIVLMIPYVIYERSL